MAWKYYISASFCWKPQNFLLGNFWDIYILKFGIIFTLGRSDKIEHMIHTTKKNETRWMIYSDVIDTARDIEEKMFNEGYL